MQIVNMQQAKSNLSKLVKAIEECVYKEVTITKNGYPVAKLVPIFNKHLGQRIGVAKGLFQMPNNSDALNDQVANLFTNAK